MMGKRELDDIARALGGAQRQGSGWVAFCPAHDNKRTPALSLDMSAEGRLLVNCHAGCYFVAVLDALAGRGLIEKRDGRSSVAPVFSPAERRKREAEERAEKNRRMRYALDLWRIARRAEGTPVEVYLREARAIPLRSIPSSLRYLPGCKHPSGEAGGAMVALVRNSAGVPSGIHRTWLLEDGSGKADLVPQKAMLGVCKGGGVWFGAVDRWNDTGVGEGIESTLSFMAGCPVPMIATLSTSGMSGLILPPPSSNGSRLYIASDNDAAGLRASDGLRQRAGNDGWRASVSAPEQDGFDFNDLLCLEMPVQSLGA